MSNWPTAPRGGFCNPQIIFAANMMFGHSMISFPPGLEHLTAFSQQSPRVPKDKNAQAHEAYRSLHRPRDALVLVPQHPARRMPIIAIMLNRRFIQLAMIFSLPTTSPRFVIRTASPMMNESQRFRKLVKDIRRIAQQSTARINPNRTFGRWLAPADTSE